MAQDASQRWNRTEGVIIALDSGPQDIARLLDEMRVVARVEWFPATAHLMSLTLLSDAQGRVAVTPPSRGGVVAGPSMSSLVEDLARACQAQVAIGPAGYDALPDDAEMPHTDAQDSARSRTVVVSPLSAFTVPLQATLLERPLAVAQVTSVDRRVVMYSGEGNQLGAFGWDEESLPAVVFTSDEHDMSILALPTADPEDAAVYSWGMESRYVYGGVAEPGPALTAIVEELLADTVDAEVIAQAVPGADLQAVRDALRVPGVDGMVAMVRALGLPTWVESVLTGRLAPAEVPGVVVHEPRGWSNAVGRSVGVLLNDPGTPGGHVWRRYVRTVTDMPWVVRAATVLEATVGGVLVGYALRRRTRGGGLSGGLLGGGILLMADAVVETSMASVVRHRELRRRADEEMALVAEELGA